MHIPETVIRSNGKAVSLLRDGKCAESAREIRHALSQLKKVIMHPDDDSAISEDSSDSSTTYVDMDAESSSFSEDNESPISSIIVPVETGASIAQIGAFSLFNRALVITQRDQIMTMRESRVSCILLYNAALCHHIEGFQSGCSQELSSALQFYQYAFSLLTEANDVENDDLLLLLSLINNMGHIYSNVFDFPAAEHCMDMMNRFFSTGADQYLGECDSLFFYMNTFLVRMDQFSSAPAA